MKSVSDIAATITAVGVLVLVVLGLFWQLEPGAQPEGTPGVVYASTTVNCKSGKSFEISTGNNSGSCTIKESEGTVTGGSCTDGANESSASCNKNEGVGACGSTQGSGGCKAVK